MRFHFDPKQKHQLDAIDAVLRVFEGQPAGGSEVFHQTAPGEAFAETGFANRLVLDEKQILENVHAIQRENISKHGKGGGARGACGHALLRGDGDRHRQNLCLSAHDL